MKLREVLDLMDRAEQQGDGFAAFIVSKRYPSAIILKVLNKLQGILERGEPFSLSKDGRFEASIAPVEVGLKPKPSIGRIVRFHSNRLVPAGVHPAIITQVFDDDVVDLHVFWGRGGGAPLQYDVRKGTGDGEWDWPY